MRGVKAKRLRAIQRQLVMDGADPPVRVRKLARWLREGERGRGKRPVAGEQPARGR